MLPMMKKLTAIALCLTMLLGITSPVFAAEEESLTEQVWSLEPQNRDVQLYGAENVSVSGIAELKEALAAGIKTITYAGEDGEILYVSEGLTIPENVELYMNGTSIVVDNGAQLTVSENAQIINFEGEIVLSENSLIVNDGEIDAGFVLIENGTLRNNGHLYGETFSVSGTLENNGSITINRTIEVAGKLQSTAGSHIEMYALLEGEQNEIWAAEGADPVQIHAEARLAWIYKVEDTTDILKAFSDFDIRIKPAYGCRQTMYLENSDEYNYPVDITITQDIEIPGDCHFWLHSGDSGGLLTVPEGVTLTVNEEAIIEIYAPVTVNGIMDNRGDIVLADGSITVAERWSYTGAGTIIPRKSDHLSAFDGLVGFVEHDFEVVEYEDYWHVFLKNAGSGTPPASGATLEVYPANGAENQWFRIGDALPELRLTFESEIAVDSSNRVSMDFTKAPFSIYRASDNKLIYRVAEHSLLPGTNADFHRYGNKTNMLYIWPTNRSTLFEPDTEYYVTMGAGFIKLSDGSTCPAIKKGDWSFTTGMQEVEFEFLPNDDGAGRYTFDYSDHFFDRSSTVYNHELAIASLSMAMAAFDDGGSGNIEALFDDLGMGNDRTLDYHVHTSDTVCYAIGSKPLDLPNEGENTLVAVAICGSGYQAEWGGNFEVGASGDHKGFQTVSNEVLLGIQKYLSQHALNENLKIWITGYSRASACANLTAARLCDGYLESALDIELAKDDIYAYCFEVPKGTTETDRVIGYENIFNIVNPIDLVPKVAPFGWGFGRYGVTYYLPCAETEPQYSDIIRKVTREYTQIMKGTTENGLSAVKQLEGQGAKLDDVLSALTDAISRKSYAETLQPIAVPAIAEATRNQKGGSYNYQIVDAIIDVIQENPREFKALTTTIEKALKCKVTWYLIGEQIVENVLSAVGLEGATFFDTVEMALSTIMHSHYPEVTLAWMHTVDGFDDADAGPWYRRLYVNCPVDVAVYDSEDRLVARFIDDEAQQIEDSLIPAYLDSDGQKIVILPPGEEYRVELEATGDGTMTCSLAECSAIDGEVQRVMHYYDVDITEGVQFSMNAPAAAQAQTVEYSLSEGDTEIEASEVQEDYISYYSVDAEVLGDAEVYGGGKYMRGEYARLTYESEYPFLGWYEGDVLLSADAEYRFRVEKNLSVKAVFERSEITEVPIILSGYSVGARLADATATTLAPGLTVQQLVFLNEDGEDCTEETFEEGKIYAVCVLLEKDPAYSVDHLTLDKATVNGIAAVAVEAPYEYSPGADVGIGVFLKEPPKEVLVRGTVEQNGVIVATVINLIPGVESILAVAQYEGGKLVDVQLKSINTNGDYVFDEITHAEGFSYKVFLLNAQGYVPLCHEGEF